MRLITRWAVAGLVAGSFCAPFITHPLVAHAATTYANVKVKGWDGECLTYAHPVAGSKVGLVPCASSHNWDVTSGGNFIAFAHGTALGIGDSGGNVVLKRAPSGTEMTVGPVWYKDYAGYAAWCWYGSSLCLQQRNARGTVAPVHGQNVHDAYALFYWR